MAPELTALPSQLGMLKGFYNKNSTTQASCVHNCRELLVRAAEDISLPGDHSAALHIAEWGCAHGGNSIAPVYTISGALNQRIKLCSKGVDRKLQLHVSHTDVAGNSWTELFQCAKQYQQEVHDNFPQLSVTYSGIGSSQYVRNHPSSTLDIGFSFNAVHWLSKWPCRLQHSMSPFSSKVLPEESAALTSQAIEDLTTFLTLRADEFKAGGMLVMSYATLGLTNKKWLNMFSGPESVAESMVADGLLREDKLGALATPVYFLDQTTQKQVFEAVSDKWELLHLYVAVASNPQVEALLREGADISACGQIFANFFKAAMCPFMDAGLRASGRDKSSVESLLDCFFERLALKFAANPVSVGYPTARVMLRRRE